MWGWKNATTFFPVGKSTDDIKTLGKHLIKKSLMDTPHVGVIVREQCKIQNLVGNQNYSDLYSIVVVWQRELVHLPTQNDMSNKKMLLCLQAIKPLMPECARAPAGVELSEHRGFPSKAEAGLKLVPKL